MNIANACEHADVALHLEYDPHYDRQLAAQRRHSGRASRTPRVPDATLRGDQHRPSHRLDEGRGLPRARPASSSASATRTSGGPSLGRMGEGRQGTSPSPQRTKSATVTAAAVTPVSVI